MLINYSCSSITAKQLLVELSRKKVNVAFCRVYVGKKKNWFDGLQYKQHRLNCYSLSKLVWSGFSSRTLFQLV